MGFAGQTPVKGISLQESKATRCVQGNTAEVDTRSLWLYPLDSTCAVPLPWQAGAQPEAWEVWRASTLLGDLLGSGTPNTTVSCFKERCHIKQKSRKEKSWRRQFLACPCRQLHPGFWRIFLSQTCTQLVGLYMGLPTYSCMTF